VEPCNVIPPVVALAHPGTDWARTGARPKAPTLTSTPNRSHCAVQPSWSEVVRGGRSCSAAATPWPRLETYQPLHKNAYKINLSDSAVATFMEEIPSVLSSLTSHSPREDSFTNLTPPQIDHMIDSVTGALKITLDSIAPFKIKKIKLRRLAPWHNNETRIIKQRTR